jgi:hypothetical protein
MTPEGRQQPAEDRAKWNTMVTAIASIMED